MKLARGGSAEALLKQPKSPLRAALFYGPDAGLVRERAANLVVAVAGSRNDPFQVVELSVAALKEDPARLNDEAAALSMMGGRRAIWLRDATDAGLTALLKGFLETLPGEAVIAIEAGDLAAKSSLRALCESHAAAVAVPCYHDSGADLSQVIAETLRKAGLTPEPDALAYLTQHLGGDRMMSRSELDKLTLYLHGQSRVTLADVQGAVGDSAAQSLDDVIQAALDGRTEALDLAFRRAMMDGESPVGILRVLLRQMQRLHLVAAQMAGGKTAEAAIAALRPPPFKRDADRLARQVRHWPVARAAAALGRLQEAEAQCKASALPDEVMCARALLEVSENARRQRR
ncbi:DNA polymerase III subunit delta [Elstera cyanobacteriorum]|uniref:DNA polymerase III subunit delta n=1 Tax=Elstera cyanobacteriorum TaxID=2022747 RepID=UPI002357F2CD|nr:DNA polymerase III subunit delta [Elstera cyanobacteriorum]MCK6441866.1 DNA polymerase III subunit delta [Elstera cyanobacteriorum]